MPLCCLQDKSTASLCHAPYEAWSAFFLLKGRGSLACLNSHQVHCVGWEPLREDLGPGVRLYVRELELGVIGVHCMDIFPRGRAQHLRHSFSLRHNHLTCCGCPPHGIVMCPDCPLPCCEALEGQQTQRHKSYCPCPTQRIPAPCSGTSHLWYRL